MTRESRLKPTRGIEQGSSMPTWMRITMLGMCAAAGVAPSTRATAAMVAMMEEIFMVWLKVVAEKLWICGW